MVSRVGTIQVMSASSRVLHGSGDRHIHMRHFTVGTSIVQQIHYSAPIEGHFSYKKGEKGYQHEIRTKDARCKNPSSRSGGRLLESTLNAELRLLELISSGALKL